MNYLSAAQNLDTLRTPCLVTNLTIAKQIAQQAGSRESFRRETQDFKDDPGHYLCIQLGGRVARLLIMGGAETCSAAKFRNMANVMAKALLDMPIAQAAVYLLQAKVDEQDLGWKAQTLMQAMSHASYRFEHHKSQSKPASAIKRLRLLADPADLKPLRHEVRLGNALHEGLQLTKDLGNEPPNVCTPNYLLAQARKLARHEKVSLSQLDEKKMTELGMGAFMAVSQGSDNPGRMIILRYSGAPKSQPPIALVGKGITFDTGGISLKPPPGMDEMKFDMCGAAAVLGATKAAVEAQLPINLITVVAAAENMPSGRATRPGDIVKSASGQTIEILNTDAEGRLVLCDALTHVQTLKPRLIVDVATLTGACIVALGTHASGLYANDDKLAEDLLAAGERCGDRSWRLPLWDEYQTALKSNFADMANVGGKGAGSVTAACFLSRFVKKTPWAHLDIAGSAFHGGAAKGASGRPVPMLFNFLAAQGQK